MNIPRLCSITVYVNSCDVNKDMQMLSKNYLLRGRSFHGAGRQKLKFKMTKTIGLEKSKYHREAKYIETKPTIWAGFFSKSSTIYSGTRSKSAEAEPTHQKAHQRAQINIGVYGRPWQKSQLDTPSFPMKSQSWWGQRSPKFAPSLGIHLSLSRWSLYLLLLFFLLHIFLLV